MKLELKIDFPKHDLYEVEGKIIIPPNAIDSNNHVNNAYYPVIYEAERALYMATIFMPLKQIRETYRISSVLRRQYCDYERPVKEADPVIVYTAAEDRISHLMFYQRMMVRDNRVNYFICQVAIIDEQQEKLARRVHQDIRDAINQVNGNRQNS